MLHLVCDLKMNVAALATVCSWKLTRIWPYYTPHPLVKAWIRQRPLPLAAVGRYDLPPPLRCTPSRLRGTWMTSAGIPFQRTSVAIWTVGTSAVRVFWRNRSVQNVRIRYMHLVELKLCGVKRS